MNHLLLVSRKKNLRIMIGSPKKRKRKMKMKIINKGLLQKNLKIEWKCKWTKRQQERLVRVKRKNMKTMEINISRCKSLRCLYKRWFNQWMRK
jgi:hypothetical protein